MTAHPSRPGVGSTVIDIVLVAVILGCLGLLFWVAFRVLAWAARSTVGLLRPRRWPRNRRRR